MHEILHSFLKYFSALFVTLDGIGLAPVFIALTGTAPRRWRQIMMNKSIVIAFIILIFFGFAGTIVLDLLGISLNALRIAGGILLLLMAIDLVLAKSNNGMNQETNEERRESLKRTDISVFPLAIPLLSGPATITMLALFMKKAQGDILQTVLVIAALVINLGICWLILNFASNVSKILGKTGVNVINRIFGILLTAMSCEFFIDAVLDIVKNMN